MPLFQEINMFVFTIYSCQYGTLFNLYIPDYIYQLWFERKQGNYQGNNYKLIWNTNKSIYLLRGV